MNINTNTSKINRRAILGAISALAATPALAYQMPNAPVEEPPEPDWWRKLTAQEQIQHHADEMRRLLAESAPDGMVRTGDTFVMGNGHVMSNAFPADYQHGQCYAKFTAKGGWEISAGIEELA